jgi:hypothetical protein
MSKFTKNNFLIGNTLFFTQVFNNVHLYRYSFKIKSSSLAQICSSAALCGSVSVLCIRLRYNLPHRKLPHKSHRLISALGSHLCAIRLLCLRCIPTTAALRLCIDEACKFVLCQQRLKSIYFLCKRYTSCWYAWLLCLRCIPTTAALRLCNNEARKFVLCQQRLKMRLKWHRYG